AFLKRHKNPKNTIKIALIGKYVELQDSYKSILEAFIHAGAANEVQVDITSISSEILTAENVFDKIAHFDGILVAPGFGERGIEGKIKAAQIARTHKIPYFGICLGMQMAVIEFARDVLDMEDANTVEVNPNTSYPVINLMENQKDITEMGGTMRLGAWRCQLKKGSLVQSIYQQDEVVERHRHRYEFNNKYLSQFEANGMIASGINPEKGLVEVIEIKDHPWFVGVQYHPEYKSTVSHPHPLFVSFVKAALTYQKGSKNKNESQLSS
ncbi:MAG: CTP synthase, partial [Flavobacteriaceae bacterium]|nr:CTP synthase [Flavobacteriaceae bacterium]